LGLSSDQHARWGSRKNPVADTRKRRQAEIGHLEVFTVEQIDALAQAAASGSWRSRREYATPNTEHLRTVRTGTANKNSGTHASIRERVAGSGAGCGVHRPALP